VAAPSTPANAITEIATKPSPRRPEATARASHTAASFSESETMQSLQLFLRPPTPAGGTRAFNARTAFAESVPAT
jgi:hypothetical protein